MLKNSNNQNQKISSFPRDTLEQAVVVKEGWDEVGDRLAVPNLSMGKFLEKITEAHGYVGQAERLKLERANAIQQRNVCLSELWDLTKRIRNAAKATFGDNSEELELLVSFPKELG